MPGVKALVKMNKMNFGGFTTKNIVCQKNPENSSSLTGVKIDFYFDLLLQLKHNVQGPELARSKI